MNSSDLFFPHIFAVLHLGECTGAVCQRHAIFIFELGNTKTHGLTG